MGGQATEGGLFINDAGKINEFGRAFAHAVVGCMAGAAGASASGSDTSTGSGCGAGALGAVVGEFSAQLYGAADPTKTIAFASMMSGIAAAVAGQGAEGVAIAAGTGANAAQNNWLNHADEAQLAKLKQKRQAGECGTACEQSIAGLELLNKLNNRALLNACVNGTVAECTAQVNRDPAALKYGVDNALEIGVGRAIGQAGSNANKALASLGTKEQLTQLVMELMPVVGSAEAVAQLLTGKQSLTGEEASRFWAAVGIVPVVGGILHRVGNTTADVTKALQAADKAADAAKQQGLINDANRLFKQYADDIETQTGYRLNETQRTALANEMRAGNHAVTLSKAENEVLRREFQNQLPKLREEWSRQTGQAWPMVEVIKNGRVDIINAQAHHVIPVTNNGPTAWWNITPATQSQHSNIHKGPLKELQLGGK